MGKNSPMGPGRRQGTTAVLALSGLGGLLLAVEAAAIAMSPVPLTDTWLAGVLMTLPFLVGLAYGGYWLDASALPPARDARIQRWTAGGLAGFVLLNVPLMIATPPRSLLYFTSWLRWAAVLGAGLGLAVGLFEARAIQRAIDAERSRVRAAEAERREQLLVYLNSLLRHEVLNTANVIEGYADLLDDNSDAATSTEAATIIQNQAGELTSVIQDVRVLLDASQGEADLEPIDISAVVQTEIENLRERFPAVEVTTDLPDQAVVRADALVRRVVGNLLGNAVEHNDSPTPHVTVRVGAAGDTVTVEITDNGPGIPASEREDLFALETPTSADHGLGLGLVATLVARYDGDIELTETGPDGTTITGTLPMAEAAAPADSPDVPIDQGP